MGDLRVDVRKARKLLSSSRMLDREDGAGILAMAYHEHRWLQRQLRELHACAVEKYAHVSPAAAARLKSLRMKPIWRP